MKKQGGNKMIPKNYAQVELKNKKQNISGNSGLCWVDKSLEHAGFWKAVDKIFPKSKSNNAKGASLKIRSELLSRIAGASAIEDIDVLRQDKGFSEMSGMKVVSADTIRNFISEKNNEKLLKKSNQVLMLKALKASKEEAFTYDNDATYFESSKESAAYSYRKSKDFSGLLGFIKELNLCVTMDFRAGNISPCEGIAEQIEEIVGLCKKAKKRIKRVRLDSAGHSNKVFSLCEGNGITFYITLNKNKAIKEIITQIPETSWEKVNKSYEDNKVREYAEIVYAANDKNSKSMRGIVLRWENKKQLNFFEDEYSYHVVGTNDIEKNPVEILEIHAGRMDSENYNKELKGGYNIEWTPSHDFTKNTNYFYLGVLAYNCLEFVKAFYIGGEVVKYRIKKFRNWFIKTCGKLVHTGRRYIFQVINATEESFEMFVKVRRRMQYAW